MANTAASKAARSEGRWRTGLARTLVCAAAFACCSLRAVTAAEARHARHSREYFRHEMADTVRADHPAIVPVANAIRAITRDPLEQLVIVNDVAHLLVDYDDDERIYGREEFHATFDEMLARRRAAGWIYLRDDCDGRAVFAAHLLAALGIPWRLEASFWKEHAWIVAHVDGADYDLLDLRRNAPEARRLAFKLIGRHFVRPSVRPPAFAWRRAWEERTGSDLQIGLQLGMLALDSTPGDLRQRNATDWTVKAPGVPLPFDDRAMALTTAGFPLGEPLPANAIAHMRDTAAPAAGAPESKAERGSALGGSTGSGASDAAKPAGRG